MTTPKNTVTQQDDFQRLVCLLAVYTDSNNQLAALEAETNGLFQTLIEDKKEEYAVLQKSMTEAEAAAEELVRNHPEWLPGDKRSIKTPFGTANFRRSSSLDIPDEKRTITAIEWHEIQEAEAGREFSREEYVRTKETLDLEALEKLDDVLLATLHIERKHSDSFSITAAKVPMGKAVQDAIKRDTQAAKESEVAA